tara:strand:+ start:805 stop:1377 length:573 start_codon:yes stop_codon:yes gene_type:complete
MLRERLNIDENDFVFVFMGRLVGDKGINELVLAFDRLCKEHKGIKLLLVGTYENELDPLKPEVLDIITNNTHIITTGWVDEVRPYYAISNALTFPSYREGFPNVVMQAGAMELPCIVTNINGCNEIIKHQETGIIIPVKDEEALYCAMCFIVINKEQSKTMGIACRKYIAANFERKIVWEAILNEYKQLK